MRRNKAVNISAVSAGISNMKNKSNIVVIWLVAAVITASALAQRSRSISNSPVGRGVVPPSSTRSGLIRSPNPIDTSGDLVVTGNVAGGKHFRGVVPYNAFSNFSGTTGTESVDAFLRYSGGSEYYGQYSGSVAPFYSPSRTVTYITPGVGVVGPQTIYMGYREEAAQLSVSQQSKPAIPQPPRYIGPGTASGLSRNYRTDIRPMSMSLEEMEKLISSQGEILPPGKQQLEQQQAQYEQMQKFEEALKQAGDKASELERKLEYKTSIPQQPAEGQAPQPINIPPAGKQETSATSKLQPGLLTPKPSDVYEQMKQKLNMLRQGKQPQTELLPVVKETEKAVEKDKNLKEQESSQVSGKQLEALSPQEISDKAKAILGEYKTFASYSQDKFNRYMLAGERYLKEGKFYLAADAYTLASIYKSNDPLAYAGKSHALFAAGEYMSSSLYLSRTLVIFPEYARFKVDIITMVGDKDKLESRVADVLEWLKRSDAAELHFLLGYVYYQMDRPDEAKKSIDAAYEQMPEAPAVRAMKGAIYGTAQ